MIRSLAGRLVPWRGVLGLNYHRIGDGRRSVFDRGLWSATAGDFDQQVRYLKAHFDIIVPGDIPEALRARRGRHVLITFDDGYLDNYTDALPVLKAHNVKASFFVSTGFIDAPYLPFWDEIAWMIRTSRRSSLDLPDFLPTVLPFDEPERENAVRTLLRAYFRLQRDRTTGFLDAIGAATGTGRPPADLPDLRQMWLTWDRVREMLAAGMTIGGHTVNHPIMARLTRAEQMAEVTACGQRMQAELGIPMRTFAYPFGTRDAFNRDSRECLREQGVLTAFSYYGGIRKLGEWDDFDIPRIAVEQHTTLGEFRSLVMFPRGT